MVRGFSTPARLAAGLSGLAVLALLASGAAVAQPSRDLVAVTLDAPTFAGKWRQGWFGLAFSPRKRSLRVTKKGTVSVSGTVDIAASLEAVVRPVEHLGTVTAHGTFAGGPGRYSATLQLPIRPLPGKYRVSVGVVSGSGATVAKAVRDVDFKAPPEGVVGKALISATKHGRGVVVLHSLHLAYARFHFLTPPPQGRNVTIQWRTPNNQLICQTRSGKLRHGCRLPVAYHEWIYTFLRSRGTKLARGNWYCELSVNGRLARRAFVRLR